ncbi:MAG: type II secretion system F family protein [Candidatus Micrarchaeota archaeon]|nr:type II secretion system F family protein [Candidatus Micrarchaeota archaeon]
MAAANAPIKPKRVGLIASYRNVWAKMIIYNAMDINPRAFSLYLIIASIAIGVAGSVFMAISFPLSIFTTIGIVAAVHLVVYSNMYLGANSRAGKVEDVLPDFLSLVASNIRSGLTPDKALVVSARDEFGPLTEAINKAAKKSMTGMPLDEVMLGMTEQINSNVLEKTMTQIVEGMHSGGDLSELLEKTALDIRKFRSVKKEVNSIILNYELFIIAAITFGAPMLYGVSTFLVDIMLIIKKKIGGGGEAISQLSGNVGIFKGKLLFTPEGVQLFSILAISITIFFGCMAVGVMSSGKRIDGLKYFPILALMGLALLFAIRFGLTAVLGGMLNGAG